MLLARMRRLGVALDARNRVCGVPAPYVETESSDVLLSSDEGQDVVMEEPDTRSRSDRWRSGNLVGGAGTNGNQVNHDMSDLLAADRNCPLQQLPECTLMSGLMAFGEMFCGSVPSPADKEYWEEAKENQDIVVEDVVEALEKTHLVADEEMNTPTEDMLDLPDFLFEVCTPPCPYWHQNISPVTH